MDELPLIVAGGLTGIGIGYIALKFGGLLYSAYEPAPYIYDKIKKISGNA